MIINAVNSSHNIKRNSNPKNAFGGIKEKVIDFCDINQKGSISRFAFVSVAATFLLGARYFQARNADEKREVFTRDFSAVVAAVYAIPILRKFIGKYINSQGIPIAYGKEEKSTKEEKGLLNTIKKYWSKINPENGVKIVSYDQLSDWFSVKSTDEFNKIHKGFTGFCENISKIGGNLAKCFKILGHSEFADKKMDNAKILEEINNLQGDKLITLQKLFVRDEHGMNNLLRKASHSKSLVEAGCIIATAALLGWGLPGFNIWYTRKLYKDGDKKQEKTPPKNITAPVNRPQIKTLNNNSMTEKFKNFQATL